MVLNKQELPEDQDQTVAALNAVYTERNKVVVGLAKAARALGHRVGVGIDHGSTDPRWAVVLYMDLPSGQVSWHFGSKDAHMLDGLPFYASPWDGHTTEQKYERLQHWDPDYASR